MNPRVLCPSHEYSQFHTSDRQSFPLMLGAPEEDDLMVEGLEHMLDANSNTEAAWCCIASSEEILLSLDWDQKKQEAGTLKHL